MAEFKEDVLQKYEPLEIYQLLLPKCPEFFTYTQKNIYKKLAAQIIYENLNEEDNFGRFQISKAEKIQVNSNFY